MIIILGRWFATTNLRLRAINVSGKNTNPRLGDWVELSTCQDVFLLAPEILTLLRVFLYMGDLFNCPKRKTRTSNSDSETNSPEGKRICNEQNFVDAFQRDAIADDNQEVQALEASRNMEDVTKQLKLILCKLDSLETELETVIETVSNRKTTVNKLENVVDKVQGRLDYQPLFGKGARAPPPNSRLDSWTLALLISTNKISSCLNRAGCINYHKSCAM